MMSQSSVGQQYVESASVKRGPVALLVALGLALEQPRNLHHPHLTTIPIDVCVCACVVRVCVCMCVYTSRKQSIGIRT